MVSQKRYMPTNKRFQDHTKMFVGTKTKKGHLNDEDKDKNKVLTTGTLIRIVKAKMYEDGWEVRVGKGNDAKQYKCSYGDNIMYLPEYDETELYYVPKYECEVKVSIDEKTQEYFIVKVNDPNKKPIAMSANKINIQGNGSAAIQVAKDVIEAYGKVLANKDVVANSGDNEVSLIRVGSEINSFKSDGITTQGTLFAHEDVRVRGETEDEEFSLIDTGRRVNSIYSDGIETKGDLIITLQNEEEEEEEVRISVLDLFERITALEERLNEQEQNNG